MKEGRAYLLTLSVLLVLTLSARVSVEARRLILRPLSSAEVYRLLGAAGRSDAIPQGRVITQGIAAIKGFTLGVKKGFGGAMLVNVATSAPAQQFVNNLNVSGLASNIQLPQINANSLQLPQLNLNAVQLPQFNASALQLPQFNLNSLQLPQFNASALQLPQLNLNVNSLQLPQFNTSALQLPQFNLNSLQLPQLNVNSLQLPQLSNVQLPQLFNFNRGSTPAAVQVRYEEQEICFSSRNARTSDSGEPLTNDADYDDGGDEDDEQEVGRQSPTATSTPTGTATDAGTGTATGTANAEEPPTTTCVVLRTPITRK